MKDAWDEKVLVKDAYDEKVYVGDRAIQNDTGEDVTGKGIEWCKEHDCAVHFLGNGPCKGNCTLTPVYDAEYTTKTIPAKTHTVHHDAEYKSVTYCSKCGKTK